jgi:hypothetical protein
MIISSYFAALLCVSCLPLITNSKVHEVNVKFCSNCSEVVVFKKRQWYNFDDPVQLFQKFSYPRNLASAVDKGKKNYPRTNDRARPAVHQLPLTMMDACYSMTNMSSLRAMIADLPRQIAEASKKGRRNCIGANDANIGGDSKKLPILDAEWLWHYVSYSTLWLFVLPVFAAMLIGLLIYFRGDEMKSSLKKEIDAQTDEISELKEELENLRALNSRNYTEGFDAAQILSSVVKSLNDCEAQMKISKFSTKFKQKKDSNIPDSAMLMADEGRETKACDDHLPDARARLRGDMPNFFDTIYESQDVPCEGSAVMTTSSDSANMSRKELASDPESAQPYVESLNEKESEISCGVPRRNHGIEVHGLDSVVRGPSSPSDFKRISTSLLSGDGNSIQNTCMRVEGQDGGVSSRGGARGDEWLLGSEDCDFDRLFFEAMMGIKEKLASDLIAAKQQSDEQEVVTIQKKRNVEMSGRAFRMVRSPSFQEAKSVVAMAVAAIENSEDRKRIAAAKSHSQISLIGDKMRQLPSQCQFLRSHDEPDNSSQVGEDFGTRGTFAFTVVNQAVHAAAHREDHVGDASVDVKQLEGETKSHIRDSSSTDAPTNTTDCDVEIEEYSPDWAEEASQYTTRSRAVSDTSARRFSCSVTHTPPLSPLSINEYSSPLSCNTNVESVSTAVVCTQAGTY